MPMETERLISLFEKYDELLAERRYPSKRFEGDLNDCEDMDACLSHARDMIERALNLNFSTERREKAMRWLGFVQGVLWCTGVRSLEQLKQDSMPAGAEYDAARDATARKD